MNHTAITRTTHSRGAMTLTCVIAAVCALLSYLAGGQPAASSAGLVAPLSGTWTLPLPYRLATETLLNVCIVVVLIHVNKHFNLLRTATRLHCTIFVLLQMSVPTLLVSLCPGTLTALVVMLCMWPLFANYGAKLPDTRPIFLIFLILSGCSAFDITYLVYIPVYLVGCMQMRIFSLRTFTAICLGVVTPWILMLGSGVVSPADIRIPDIDLMLPFVNSLSDTSQVTTVIVTLVMTGAALLSNLFRTISYNARARALLGFVSVVTVVTAFMALLTVATPLAFLPLLNCCAGLQIAHWYSAVLTTPRAYIFIIVLLTVYLSLTAWNMAI